MKVKLGGKLIEEFVVWRRRYIAIKQMTTIKVKAQKVQKKMCNKQNNLIFQ